MVSCVFGVLFFLGLNVYRKKNLKKDVSGNGKSKNHIGINILTSHCQPKLMKGNENTRTYIMGDAVLYSFPSLQDQNYPSPFPASKGIFFF